MINLIPSKTFNTEEFWSLIKKHNEWLIKLRFLAVAMLVASLFSSMILFDVSRFQFVSILVISLTIFTYNFVLKKLLQKYDSVGGNINSIHISLLQIILDLFQLFLIIYLTGGIESPVFIFFVFHIIIGSILLPVIVIYVIAFAVSFLITLLALFELWGIVPHQQLTGLFQMHAYNRIEFVVVYLIVFNIMVYVCIYLTNKISRQLFQREQDLKEAFTKLEEAEKAKQKYVAGIIHELKTPIVAIQSMLDLVLMKFVGPVSAEVEEKLFRAKKRTEESIQIVNNVLKISKLKLLDKINKEPFAPDDLLMELIESQSPMCEYKKISIRFLDKRENKNLVEGDRQLLEIAFSNLIGNAVKYTPENGIIEVDLRNDENNLIVDIIDSGIGIPDQDVKSVFNQFYRASNLKNKKTEGTGLGLSVVKEIIDQHNGSISVVSPSKLAMPGNPGSCFSISLPLK